MNEQHLKDREENQQLTNLYKVIYSLLKTKKYHIEGYSYHSLYFLEIKMEKRLAEIIIFLSFQAEQSQANILETALANEKDNFHRLKVALDTERMRSREAIDRDNDTILDLRTALEVRVFHKLRYWFFLFCFEFFDNKPNRVC